MFENYNTLEMIFFICGAVSSIFFILRIIMMFLLGLGDADIDAGDGIDADGDAPDSGDSETSFKLLSIHTITAFFMMFGWVGLACYRQYGLQELISILFAMLGGVLSMFVTAYLFKLALKLVSPGNVFSINNTVGMKAQVYQQITPENGGKIQLSIEGDMTREIDAVSFDNEIIESFTTVEIVEVIDGHTVAVIKYN